MTRGKAILWSLAMVALTCVLMTSFTFLHVAHNQRVADRRWCDLFRTLDPPGQPAPATDRGRETQRLIRQLKTDFQCEGGQ